MGLLMLLAAAAIFLGFCQTDEKVSFYGSSYIHFPVQEAKGSTDISFRFRTHLSDAILLLAAGKTDYCLIKLEAGRLKVHINLGAGESEIASPKGLTLNDLSWHEIHLIRREANMTLQIDVIHTTRTLLPGRFFVLNVLYGVYIGGQGDFNELFLDVIEANKENVEKSNKDFDEAVTTNEPPDIEILDTTEEESQKLDQAPQDWNQEFLEMMGEELPSTNSTTKIDDTIEKQWTGWMSKGLPEESRKELLKKYSRVEKFRTEAPKVNLEVVGHLTEVAKKRDQHFTDTQNCVGTALVSLGAAMSMLMENPEDGIDHTQLMKYLWDSGKILADVFNQHSTARKSFITPNLDKDIKSTLEATVSDEWLYGAKLTDQVKDAKNIKKAAASLKTSEKPSTKKTTSQLNWRGPPGKARQVGYYPRRQFTNVKYRPRPFQAKPPQTSSRPTTQSSSRSSSKK